MRTANLSLSPVRANSSDSVSIVFDGWNAVLGASEGFGYSRRQLSTFTLDLPRLADEIAEMRHHPSRVERIAVVVPLRRYCEVRGDEQIQQVLTEWTDDRQTDVAILVSADADHLPTVADIRRRRRTHLEVARWEWQWSSLWERGLWVHHLGHDLLDSVSTDRNPRKAA